MTGYTAGFLNQYTLITGNLAEGAPQYDADGNLTQDGTWTYSYDGENRLESMSRSGQTLTFAYDYMGRRIRKTVTGAAASDTKFLWSDWELAAELAADGSTVNRSFVWGPDFSDANGSAGGAGSLLAQIDGGTVAFAMPDALGNIVGYMSSTAGMLNAEVEYSPYGRVLASAGAVSSYPFGYSGQYTDWETGLVYYGLRFYSPKHGRFVNRDPSEEAGGLNLYAFAGNGPTRGWDTLGLYDSSVNGDPVTYAYNLWVKATHDTEVTNYSPSSSVEDTDAFIWAWHGMQTRLSTPGDVIRGYAVISVVYGPDGKRTETRMDAFGNTYTYTDPNSQASNNKLPEGNVTIGHCKVLEWDCTLPEQDPNSSTLTPIGTQTTVEGRPTFDVLAAGYPTPADYDAKQLGDLIGGKVKQNLDSGVFTNTCSLRLSRAFNEAGLLLPFAPGQGNSSSGGDGNWYYPRLSTFENYVQDYWGAPMVIAPSDYPKAISGQPGLLIFQVQFSDASGHGTLWNGQNTIDGSNYSSRSTQILFWPVRPPPPPPPPTPGHR